MKPHPGLINCRVESLLWGDKRGTFLSKCNQLLCKIRIPCLIQWKRTMCPYCVTTCLLVFGLLFQHVRWGTGGVFVCLFYVLQYFCSTSRIATYSSGQWSSIICVLCLCVNAVSVWLRDDNPVPEFSVRKGSQNSYSRHVANLFNPACHVCCNLML